MTGSDDIKTAKAATQNVYERCAKSWDRERPGLDCERSWLDRFCASLPKGARLLDLGCGTGEPIGEYFLKAGYDVVGVDYAEAMIALARKRFQQGRWLHQDIRRLSVEGTFDGVYSWNGFFHLSAQEQRAAIPDLAARVRVGGAMLLTVGSREGEVIGTVSGENVYHASLSPDEYRRLLASAGFRDIVLVLEDPECQGHSVLLAVDKGGA